MKLITLKLENFQKIRDYTLDLNGQSASMFADNARGKSTCFSAFTWLMFGEDSQGRTDFDLKTLENGKPLHGLDHSVEGVLELPDGKKITLRRTYRENWSTPRGSADKVLSGHETKFWINGVPCGTKTEYDKRIAEIANKKIFQICTHTAGFTSLPWKEQRTLLLEVCGDVTDQEVIDSTPALAGLPAILNGNRLEDHRKIVDERRKAINKERPSIATRIDEVSKGMPDLPAAKRKELEAELTSLREQRSARETERLRVQAGGEVAEKRKRLSEIQGELQDVANTVRGQIDGRIRDARQTLTTTQGTVDAKARQVRQYTGELEDAQSRLATLNTQRDELRAAWGRENARTFQVAHDDHCAVCGQALPADQVEAAHEKARQEFNAAKAAVLTRIQSEGSELAGKCQRLEHQIADLRTALETAETELKTLRAEGVVAVTEVERLTAAVPDVTLNPQHQALETERAEVEATIASLQAGTAEETTKITAALEGLDEQIAGVQTEIAKFERRQQDEARIKELGENERKLSAELENVEKELFLCESFTRVKVAMLTDRINAKFRLASFRLFTELVNGGVDDTCEALDWEGTPYRSTNTGARVQVGMDIARTLQDHYGFHPPIWVDNAESVTSLPDMDCQVIRLVASKPDKELRVELEEQAVAA